MEGSPFYVYQSSKTYDHSVGLSCCFRQWRAIHSHCQYLHGYALKVHLIFESASLDQRGWVQDFGGLKPVKNWLEDTFDHKTVIAEDDPLLSHFKMVEEMGMIQLTILPKGVGCERFAELVFEKISLALENHPNRVFDLPASRRGVYLKSVTISEHTGNSATVHRVRGGKIG